MQSVINQAFRLLLILALLLPVFTFAQTESTAVPVPEPTSALESREDSGDGSLSSNIVECFDYYHYGSVQVQLSPDIEQTTVGTTLPFSGVLINENSYPIVDGSVYVKIFKYYEEGEKAKIDSNGYPLVAFFEAGSDISIPANGEKPFTFNWEVPTSLSGGSYEASFFFVTDNRSSLAGLTFTDDVTGNKTAFEITSESKNQVFFDKDSTSFNGKSYSFAKFPPEFSLDEPVVFETTVVNPSDEEKSVSIDWELYNWNNLAAGKLLDTEGDMLTLKPHEKRVVSYTATKYEGTVSYILATITDGDATSILNPRFVRNKVDEIRLNFPSIETFPLKAGQETSLFSCVQGTSFNVPVVKGGTLTLSLHDINGELIHSYKYEGDIKANMTGVLEKFIPEKNYSYFTLNAKLEHNGIVVEDVTKTYDCNKIDSSLCFEPEIVVVPNDVDSLGSLFKTLIIFFVALIVFIGILLLVRRNNNKIGEVTAGLFLLVIIGFGLVPGEVEAGVKSVNWNNGWRPYGPGTWTHQYASITYKGYVYSVPAARILSDGDRVSVDTHLQFRRSTALDTDISWFIAGGWGTSPYGVWDAWTSETECTFGTGCPRQIKANSPTISMSHGGTAGLSCWNSGFDCTVTSAGTIVSSLIFSATTINFSDGSLINVPIQTITFNLTAYQPNRKPNNPTVAASGGNVGQSIPFTFRSWDADGDNVAYLIDWNNDSIGDEWTGWYVSDGTATVNHSWASAGRKRVKAKAYDGTGVYSAGWGYVDVDIVNPILPPTVVTGVSTPAPTSAVVRSTVNPNGAATNAWFRYGTTNTGSCSTLSNITTGTAMGSGNLARNHNRTITGLAPVTTYYYCAIATNSQGTVAGSISSFTTPVPIPSTPTGLSASSDPFCGARSNNLTWDATTNATSYTVLVDGVTAINVGGTSFTHSGLVPGRTYSYKIRANGVSGSSAYSAAKNARVTPQPVGYDTSCPSSPNVCGQVYTGLIQCNASCSVTAAPPDSDCPPVVSMSASPLVVDSGRNSTLTWNVSNAVSCIGTSLPSLLGWNNTPKTAANDFEVVNPIGDVTYTITCDSGTGNTDSDSATVLHPGGSINARDCTIPIGFTSCNTDVTWNSSNFLGGTSVTQSGTAWSSSVGNQSAPGLSFPVNPTNDVFTLKDTGGVFVRTDSANSACDAGSAWTNTTIGCLKLPELNVSVNQNIVRNGEVGKGSVSVLADYPLNCTIIAATEDVGGLSTFTHPGSASPVVYSFTTLPLTSAQQVQVECVHPSYVDAKDTKIARIDVTASVEER